MVAYALQQCCILLMQMAILHEMGRRILFVTMALFMMHEAHRTDASRFYPTSQELNPKFHALINKTNLTRRLIDQVYPNTDMVYFAYHGAVLALAQDGYYGFIGTMDMYGLSLTPGQGSAAAVWIQGGGDGTPSNMKYIMIGWDVYPAEYGDSRTHFYTKWTNDGFQSTGCINMKCAGFQPEKGASISPGGVIEHVSSPNGAKQNLNLKIIKDGTSGDWLVHVGINRDPELIGRFPRSLFSGGFADRAAAVTFGGVVAGPITNPPPMGSGHLPTDDKSAASISNIQFIDKNGHAWPLTGDLPKFETNQNAYAVSPVVDGKFFYGGHA
ncbi:hypothetical protein EJB05_41088, partial [Eragrostis curvula]